MKQKQLLTEIMNADAKDGLYDHSVGSNKMVTAVEWLEQSIKNKVICAIYERLKKEGHFEKAKEMEKEQIMKAYANGSNDRLKNRINEKYYKETYEN